MDDKNNKDYNFIKPSHYNQYGMETVEMIDKVFGHKECAIWCKITAFKYRQRMGLKPGEDVERELEKEKAYLDFWHHYDDLNKKEWAKEIDERINGTIQGSNCFGTYTNTYCSDKPDWSVTHTEKNKYDEFLTTDMENIQSLFD